MLKLVSPHVAALSSASQWLLPGFASSAELRNSLIFAKSTGSSTFIAPWLIIYCMAASRLANASLATCGSLSLKVPIDCTADLLFIAAVCSALAASLALTSPCWSATLSFRTSVAAPLLRYASIIVMLTLAFAAAISRIPCIIVFNVAVSQLLVCCEDMFSNCTPNTVANAAENAAVDQPAAAIAP